MVDSPSTLPATPSSTPDADSSDDAGSQDRQPDGGTQDVNGLAGGPGSQHTDGGEAPAKNATNPATGGTTTPDGSSSGPDDQPSGTFGSEPTEEPSSTVTTTTLPTDSASPTPTPTATATPTSEPTVPPTQTPKVRVHQVLRYYNDVLADTLDPNRLHLQPYDRKVDSKETTTLGGRLYALGSTYRWEDGRSRSGLQIRVASGWDQVTWLCGASYADWNCHLPTTKTASPPGAAPAEVATHDGVTQVAVEHAGGQVVVVTADPTYDLRARAQRGHQH